MAASKTSARTIRHYEANAADFWEGTKDHDVTQNYAAFLAAIEASGAQSPFTILDFGCGPGRDLAYFRSLGHKPTGLDGCASFCEMARRYSGCEVLHQDFLALSLNTAVFDGVFANASLFHVPSGDLPRVLATLRSSLRPAGVLFSSNPRGDNWEGWNEERYGTYWSDDQWHSQLVAAGFEAVTHYYRPTNAPPEEQRWLASVWKKSPSK